jgi:aminoglycoside 3-N-acetyltransferase
MRVTDLVEAWRRAGIELGDTVLVHSNATRLLLRFPVEEREKAPELIVQSFLDAVGPEGTVLWPTFNHGFTRGEEFNIRSTPSRMGVLTEAARNYRRLIPKFRSGHPIYSFVAIGPKAFDFNVCNSSGFGTDSPFGLLLRAGGKIAVLDLPDQDSMTFVHYVEECHQVDYRYHKSFTGPYVDRHGVRSQRTFSLFVRDLGRGVVPDLSGLEAQLWKRNYYQGERPGEGWGLRTIPARLLFLHVSEIINMFAAKGMLYREEMHRP